MRPPQPGPAQLLRRVRFAPRPIDRSLPRMAGKVALPHLWGRWREAPDGDAGWGGRTCLAVSLSQPVDQACRRWREQHDPPKAPPDRTRAAPHQLVAAEPAETVERSSDAAAVSALVQLQAAVRAPRLLGMVEDHRRLVAPRAQAWCGERKSRQPRLSF